MRGVTLYSYYGEAMLELRARKNAVPAGQASAMIQDLWQGLKEDSTASNSKFCQWLDVPRRIFYYRPHKEPCRLNPVSLEPMKAMIEEEPSFGYLIVTDLPGFDKYRVQRMIHLKRWQVRKRLVDFRLRTQLLPSVAMRPDES
jgi:putative transposase